MDDGSLELYKMRGAQVESHLAYAADVILFCRAMRKSFTTINRILVKFSNFFKLTVNNRKSFIIYSALMENQEELSGILGFPEQHLPIKHLGMPITRRTLNEAYCNRLLV